MLCPVCGEDRQPSIQLNPGKGANTALKVCPCGHVHGSAYDDPTRKVVSVGTPGAWSNPGQESNNHWVPQEPRPEAAPQPIPAPTVPAPASTSAPIARAEAQHPASPPATTGTQDLLTNARRRLSELEETLPALVAERNTLRRMLRAADRAPRTHTQSNVVPIAKKASP